MTTNNKTFIADKEVIIQHVSSISAGYGHKKITADLVYNGEAKKFNSTTTNMPAYDKVTDIEDSNDKQLALYYIIENSILDQASEWVESITEDAY